MAHLARQNAGMSLTVMRMLNRDWSGLLPG